MKNEWLKDRGMWVAFSMLAVLSFLIIYNKVWHWGIFPVVLGDVMMIGYIVKRLIKDARAKTKNK